MIADLGGFTQFRGRFVREVCGCRGGVAVFRRVGDVTNERCGTSAAGASAPGRHLVFIAVAVSAGVLTLTSALMPKRARNGG
jgi:hypothetical protein